MAPTRSGVSHSHAQRKPSSHSGEVPYPSNQCRSVAATIDNPEKYIGKIQEGFSGSSNCSNSGSMEYIPESDFSAIEFSDGLSKFSNHADISSESSTKAVPSSRKVHLGFDTSSPNVSFNSSYSAGVSNIRDSIFDNPTIDSRSNTNDSSSSDNFSPFDAQAETTSAPNGPGNVALDLCGIGG
ncbi:uncharacterized protein BP5553_05867 [Venustampulla echinocandica]|uniref:Uncharacterized protein n=1 Tax=Venustampulla echinocandica TaxID=2656787 RepID=A0A370TLX0_9HELO|nr:uncharacterized protein BP5553_05867 [Venustampulla echinocandica]RDL36515.1 hypothetical protein BP5553_05867 [Venustampulla echinocandica]